MALSASNVTDEEMIAAMGFGTVTLIINVFSGYESLIGEG